MRTEPISRQQMQRRMERFFLVCERHDVVVTEARERIYQVLAGSNAHPDVESIFRRARRTMPNLSRDTVYRAVRLFKEIGLLRAVESSPDRIRYDADLDDHQHFVCIRCGTAYDLPIKGQIRLPIPAPASKLGRVLEARVEYRGICRACSTGEGLSQPKRNKRTRKPFHTKGVHHE